MDHIMHAVDKHKAAVAHANTEIYRRFKVRGPFEPGTYYHGEWLKEYDRAMTEIQ